MCSVHITCLCRVGSIGSIAMRLVRDQLATRFRLDELIWRNCTIPVYAQQGKVFAVFYSIITS